MILKLNQIILTVFVISASLARPVPCAADKPRIIEDTKIVMGSSVRIQIPVSIAKDEASSRAAIAKAFKEADALASDKVSMGMIIDKIVAVLKGSGIDNAFVNSPEEMYSLGMKSGREMWKAWIPHPTEKNKVYAILRLKDKAIATVRNDSLSASVVADDAATAEKLARDILARGVDGIKDADSKGVDALLIIRDGKKFRTEMAGGFKEQYGKAKKK